VLQVHLNLPLEVTIIPLGDILCNVNKEECNVNISDGNNKKDAEHKGEDRNDLDGPIKKWEDLTATYILLV